MGPWFAANSGVPLHSGKGRNLIARKAYVAAVARTAHVWFQGLGVWHLKVV